MKKFACSLFALVACCSSLSFVGCSGDTAPVKPETFGAKPGAEATPGKKQTMDSKSNVDKSIGTAD